MEFKELKTKKENELHRLLSGSRDKLRDLRFKDANKQLKDVREIRVTKKIVAKILTLLNKKSENKESLTKEVDKITSK